jgi:small subunit ribosomal protein S7
MGLVMNFLRTAPAPIYSPKFPLLPGSPPASHLPLNPILYLVIAIDSVAPLLKIRIIAGGGGGGRSLELPEPLPLRARRRMAFKWILDIVSKKPSKGSGRKQLPHRIAEEIIAVVEGRSSVWEKRRIIHKQGTTARANVGTKIRLKKTIS